VFLRNHDELTLEMVTSRERDYMYQMYAADPRARINVGIRRRLAPLLDNDMDRIRLMNSLLFSMPGTPVIYYGDEIGMGDNVYLGDRDGVRTPMQWKPERNAGFSSCDPQRLFLPPVMDPIYGYQSVNVEAQSREPSSLLNWMRRMLSVRKTVKAFGRGTLTFLHPGNRKVLAYQRDYGEERILCVANLARTAQPVELDLASSKGRVPIELFGRTPFPPVTDRPYMLTLPGHGFMWFRLARNEDVSPWHEERPTPDELPVLVLFDGWNSLFRDRVVPWRMGLAERVRAQLERSLLPKFIAPQRWFAGKDAPVTRVTLVDHVMWPDSDDQSWLVTLAQAERENAPAQTYFLPLALAWEDTEEERHRTLLAAAIAKVRQQAAIGVLADALADERFCRAIVAAIGAARELKGAHGVFKGQPTRLFAELAGNDPGQLPVRMGNAQSSNTTVAIGGQLFLKAYRHAQRGVNPDAEIGRYLTEVAQFRHCIPVAGTLDHVAEDGTPTTLVLLQGFVDNQGDGFAFSVNYLAQFLEARTTNAGAPLSDDPHAGYLALVRTLGTRTAELHLALGKAASDPAFKTEPATQPDVAAWCARAREQGLQTLDRLAQRLATLPAAARADAEQVLTLRNEIARRLADCPGAVGAPLIRVHGDYHLGQVLLVKNDFVITDFEGEPARPLAERRRKQSPLKDVAGMLRSFDYAMHTAVKRVSVDRPDLVPALLPLAQRWQSETVRAFLEAYRATTSLSGLLPEGPAAQAVLDFFVMDKALYELAYELDNRPEWLGIPLRGIASAVSSN
jgi:maltose alpha-D-glucosyltransferase/alpha-amylase